MRYEDYLTAARLRAKLPRLRRLARAAQDVVREALRGVEAPYVAYSTGKDSQALLDIALSVEPRLAVVWHDEDWVLPGTLETLAATEAHYGIRIWRVRERRAADEFFSAYGQWPRCDQPRAVDFEADRWSEIVAHFGFDAVLLGLRGDESAGRRFATRQAARHVKYDNLLHVYPLRAWRVEDVWAYLADRQLPIHPAYRAMLDAGVPLDAARVGPLTAVRVYAFGTRETVKRLWPAAWNAFAAQNPCVRT